MILFFFQIYEFFRSFRDHDVSVTMVTPSLPTIRSSGRCTSPSKKEELRKKARQMLENPSAAVSAMKTTSTDDSRRRQEARRLIEDAVTDGATYLVGPVEASTSMTSSHRSSRSHSSLNGSSSDLRKIANFYLKFLYVVIVVQLFRISTTDDYHPYVQQTRSIACSSTKTMSACMLYLLIICCSSLLFFVKFDIDLDDATPVIPGMGRPTQMMNDRLKSRGAGTSSAFDRVKRFGSMRSQELKEAMAQLAKQYGINDTPSGSQSSIGATPTRKVTSQWEVEIFHYLTCYQAPSLALIRDF
ncbi:hypothetical protein ANCCAN_13749 [Ancylostoma caninum]|uniref:Uncharacterized protein n=1 Tax=Ancylostoma caninum TaxID=29170 RepID=A0A368GBE9_ANCCA|nr:hypothetical protein ANCCAN_13749 [Ancylostoma caninum]